MIRRLKRRMFRRIDSKLYRAQLVRRYGGKDTYRWVRVKAA